MAVEAQRKVEGRAAFGASISNAMLGDLFGKWCVRPTCTTLPGCDFFQHMTRHAECKLVLAQKYRSGILFPQQRRLFFAMGTH